MIPHAVYVQKVEQSVKLGRKLDVLLRGHYLAGCTKLYEENSEILCSIIR